jgi:hypothetical protein
MTRRRAPADPTPDLSLAGPAALLEAVPYLLGFHPRESLVLVGLEAQRVVVTVRIDLTDLDQPGLLTHTVEAAQRGGARSFVGVVYTAAPAGPGERLPGLWTAEAMAGAVGEAGGLILDVLLVAVDRWWSYSCADPECCPDHGQPLPVDPSLVSATATYAGLVALPDRDALAATLDPAADRERLQPTIERHEQAGGPTLAEEEVSRRERSLKRALFAAARAADERVMTGRWQISDEDVVRFGVALRAIPLRDAVWMAIEDGRLDGRALWLELARRLPSPYDAAPLFLFGWGIWRDGNGALAGIAADRAILSDPEYSAADLLLAALARAVDPRRLPRLRLRRSA